jgi:hypothetical protein
MRYFKVKITLGFDEHNQWQRSLIDIDANKEKREPAFRHIMQKA